MNTQPVFLQGNEAIVEGAIAAGARYYAGYPITPSSEIAELASRRLPALGGIYIQMEDELASMAAIIGASLAGVMSFTATSGPGLSLMQENLGVAIMAEVPCVVVDVQRSGPSTGLATKPAQADVMQARWGAHGDHSAIVLAPGSVAECYWLTVRAFQLAEQFRHPVLVLSDAIVGHMREGVHLPIEPPAVSRRVPQSTPEQFEMHGFDSEGIPQALPPFGSEFIVRANSSMHDDRGYPSADPSQAERLIRRLHDKVERAADALYDDQWVGPADADVCIVSFGASWRTALQLVADQSVPDCRIAALQLRTLWPLSESLLQERLGHVPVVVAEMNLGQLVREIRRVLGKDHTIISATKSNGEAIRPEELVDSVKAAMQCTSC